MAAEPTELGIRDRFNRVADVLTASLGSPFALAVAAGVIVSWAVTGPLFRFSDTWQLVINTGTTIVTFLMVFVIQNSQNRDSKALHLKLDEVIRALDEARDDFVTVEQASDEELKAREDEMAALAERVAHETGHPEVKPKAREIGRATAREKPALSTRPARAARRGRDATKESKSRPGHVRS